MHPPRPSRHGWRPVAVAALVAGALFWVGCSESPDSTCGTDDDCPEPAQSCVEGVCQVTADNECTIDADCKTGFYCDDFTCKRQKSPDAGPTDGGGADTDQTQSDGGDTGAETGDAGDTDAGD
ncbi:MAG: hypothetical protein ABEN55_10340 [Bradymonadaceae bacterium]